jgi:hypothetical protein
MPASATARAGATESERLRGKIQLVLPALTAAGRRLTDHPRARELYPEYLFVSHCIIRASVPLMETARARAEATGGDDPVSAGVARYYRHHIDDELHHDEWLLEDAEVVGRDRAEFLERPPPPVAAALVGAQYYWIEHYHPVALLGYIAVLEGYPPSSELISELRSRTGYPERAFYTLTAHSELDLHHRDEFDEMLDELPLTAQQSAIVGLSALHTVHGLVRALDEVTQVS